eukprot:6198388-Pleurochrysis_carterae.AAC.3
MACLRLNARLSSGSQSRPTSSDCLDGRSHAGLSYLPALCDCDLELPCLPVLHTLLHIQRLVTVDFSV